MCQERHSYEEGEKVTPKSLIILVATLFIAGLACGGFYVAAGGAKHDTVRPVTEGISGGTGCC
jgi:hypothetical protein